MGEAACVLECEEMSAAFNKYLYSEFAGYSGERYLKKLLRQIVPMALYRTWEIFADHQAPGNDCYLGVAHLAEIAGRATRTMEKNLASLNAKRLLSERAERKFFRREDGQVVNRVVMVKDFAGLYALAHEYHQWLESEEYIAPERELIALVEQEPRLVAKLRRFENYRRLLYNRLPGPPPLAREEDSWFTDYQAEQLPVEEHKQTVQAEDPNSVFLPAKYSPTHLSEALSDSSVKRKREAPTSYRQRQISDDSASTSLQSCLETSTQASSPTDAYEGQVGKKVSDVVTFQPSSAQENEQLALPETNGTQGYPSRDLVASFLSEITLPFGDRSPKGTRTRVLSILREAHLERPYEIIACLFRAYLVARDTNSIRPEHCHPITGQANRMPLFCSLVQRFAHENRQESISDASWLRFASDIAIDSCLGQWWKEHRASIEASVVAVQDKAAEIQRDLDEAETEDDALHIQAEAPRRPRGTWLSQNDEQRAQRVAYAHNVLRRLSTMAVPIQGATALWEHLACGCPVYHQCRGREVCALCFPDPAWSEEALQLLRSIVESGEVTDLASMHENGQDHISETATATAQLQSSEPDGSGWVERDEAYACASTLLDEMARSGYVVEVFLQLVGERYQILIRGADGELFCENAEQVNSVIDQARNGLL